MCFGGLFVCKFSTHHSLMGFGPQRFHSELTTHARDLRHKGFASCGTCATSAIISLSSSERGGAAGFATGLKNEVSIPYGRTSR